jgi:hypothetical protein
LQLAQEPRCSCTACRRFSTTAAAAASYPPPPSRCSRSAFRDEFLPELGPGSLIEEVVVGCGPCGELRYPSYPEANGWRFPGVGEFQCYDRRALASLAAAAREHGEPEWGNTGPHDAGSYNASPEETGFFCSWGGNWETPYGRWGRAAAWWGRVEEGLRRKLARLPCSLDMGRHGSAPMLPGGAGCVVWIGASRCTIFPPPQQTQINRHSCPPPPNTPTPSSQLLPGVVQRRAAGARRAHAYCSDIRLQHARVGWGLGVAGRGA